MAVNTLYVILAIALIWWLGYKGFIGVLIGSGITTIMFSTQNQYMLYLVKLMKFEKYRQDFFETKTEKIIVGGKYEGIKVKKQ